MIIGIGADILRISRIKRIVESRHAANFCRKVLSSEELALYYQLSSLHDKTSYLAARWSAKEALVKSLDLKSLLFSETSLAETNRWPTAVNLDVQLGDRNIELLEHRKYEKALSFRASVSWEEDLMVSNVICYLSDSS